MNTLGKMALLVSLVGGSTAIPAEAMAVNADGFGQQAAAVAREGGCKNIRGRSNGGDFAYSGLICDLRGQRVNVLTYKNKAEEKRWLNLTCRYLPDQWVTIGYGYVITAKDGNRKAAKTAERVYGGDAYVCSDVG